MFTGMQLLYLILCVVVLIAAFSQVCSHQYHRLNTTPYSHMEINNADCKGILTHYTFILQAEPSNWTHACSPGQDPNYCDPTIPDGFVPVSEHANFIVVAAATVSFLPSAFLNLK